ncbi:hypothetical protein MFIFM68171_01729 [Madurella fahalii]|uniref:Major facilitator superfamily (MFS) profile domain-containing protein n=1 Tax=Madurella fahalii TaxID=1157608 RepID=A0ABQ0G1I2_9PEZI
MTAIPSGEQPPQSTIGFRAYSALAGGFLALFSTVGFLNAYGVFQAYYQTALLREHSASAISWIGSVSVFLLYLGSGLAGPLVDRVGPTRLLSAGSAALLAAVFAASWCERYWQLFLAQGVLLGLGMSLVFCTPLGVVMRHMPRRRGLAVGVTIGGASIGGVVWPVVLQKLLVEHRVGFAWSMRVVGFAMLPLLGVVCLTVVEPRTKPVTGECLSGRCDGSQGAAPDTPIPDNGTEEKMMSVEEVDARQQAKRPKTDFSVLRKRTYIFLCVGLAIAFLGWFTPIFYISAYAVARGQSSSTAFYLVAALNAASCFGRVVPGYLADKYGHYNLLTISALLSGAVGFAWTAAVSLAGLVAWALAYGFVSGAVISLQAACAGKVASHQSQGTAVGFLMACVSVSALIGTPISGQILSHSGYLALSIWTGTTLAVGAAVVGTARLSESKSVRVAF